MGKRLTYEFVKNQFEKEGYKLLSKEYINAHTKLRYKCPKGHECSINWGNWKNKKRCPYCARNVKLDMEFIRFEFEKEGYELLTTEYVNAHQKLECICPKGHKHNITWNKWQAGHRCPYCAGKVKKTIEFIRSEFEKEGYQLLSIEYISAHQKLYYICPHGHQHSVSWTSWQQGHRCLMCYQINNVGSNHPNWKDYSKEDLKGIYDYKVHVWQLTNHNYRKYLPIINPLNLYRSRNNYQLDHIYSIMEGFRNSILPEIIANPNNLQMLLESINIAKSDRSDISLQELYNRYNNWRKKNAV